MKNILNELPRKFGEFKWYLEKINHYRGDTEKKSFTFTLKRHERGEGDYFFNDLCVEKAADKMISWADKHNKL